MQLFIPNLMASSYGEDSYGECAYSVGCTDTNQPGGGVGPGTDPGSGLADTGVWVVGIVTLACLVIFTVLLVRWLARRNRNPGHRTIKSGRNKS